MKTKSIVIILVVVVIILAVVAYVIGKNNNKTDNTQTQPDQTSQYGTPQNAPQGQLADGFPQELVFDDQNLVSSYKIPYQGSDQFTANFTSDKSIKDIYNEYLDYFTSQNSNIINKTLDADLGVLYVSDDTADINVQVTTVKGVTTTVVTYLKK